MTGVELHEQISRILEEVNRAGGCTVTCDDPRILCPDYMTVSEQFSRIAEIARNEGWSFAFLPDGTVRCGSFA